MSMQKTLRALSDPVRRDILNLLKKKKMSAGEICEHFSITNAAISRHLSILKESDLIQDQRDGKYIGKIGCVGEGPGEYIMPFYFVIDEKNDKLYLWDRAVNKILIYNISTFKFVNEFFIPFNASCFEKLGDKHFVFYIPLRNLHKP